MNIFTFPAWPAADPANPGPGTAPAQRWRRGTGVPRSSNHLLRAAPIPSLLFKPLGFLISMTTGLPVRERRAVPECTPQALKQDQPLHRSRLTLLAVPMPRALLAPCPAATAPPSRGWAAQQGLGNIGTEANTAWLKRAPPSFGGAEAQTKKKPATS